MTFNISSLDEVHDRPPVKVEAEKNWPQKIIEKTRRLFLESEIRHMIQRNMLLDHPWGGELYVVGYLPETGHIQLKRFGGMKRTYLSRWFSSREKGKVKKMHISETHMGYSEIFWIDLDSFLKLRKESRF